MTVDFGLCNEIVDYINKNIKNDKCTVVFKRQFVGDKNGGSTCIEKYSISSDSNSDKTFLISRKLHAKHLDTSKNQNFSALEKMLL